MATDDTKIEGHLYAYYGQETEGTIVWWLQQDGKGQEGLTGVDQGDLLTVFNDEARTDIAWQGTVDFDYNLNRVGNDWLAKAWRDSGFYNDLSDEEIARETSLQVIDPVKGGQGVDGLQKGLDPKIWADMFYQHKPATLIRKTSLGGLG